MSKQIDSALTRIAAGQHGLLSRVDIAEAGGDSHFVSRRLRSGSYRRAAPGVVALAGAASTWEQSVLAAVMSTGEGAVVSHHTAAFLHGLVESKPERIAVSTTKSHTPKRVWRIHRRHELPASHRTRKRGIPITSVLRTLVDCVADGADAAALLDTAGRLKLTRLGAAHEFLTGLAGRGRAGVPELVAEVEKRLRWEGISESELESMFHRLLRDNDVPPPDTQFEIRRCDGTSITRADNAYVGAKAIIAIDGYKWHSDHTRFQKDRTQQNELASMGWRTFRYTVRHLEESPEVVIEQVRSLSAES